MTEGFNHRDVRVLTRMYTSDAALITARGERLRGTTEFEKGPVSIFATRAREATLRTIDTSVRFVRSAAPLRLPT